MCKPNTCGVALYYCGSLCTLYRSSPYNADDRAGINVQLDMLKPIPPDSDAEETSKETSYVQDKIVMKVCNT